MIHNYPPFDVPEDPRPTSRDFTEFVPEDYVQDGVRSKILISHFREKNPLVNYDAEMFSLDSILLNGNTELLKPVRPISLHLTEAFDQLRDSYNQISELQSRTQPDVSSSNTSD